MITQEIDLTEPQVPVEETEMAEANVGYFMLTLLQISTQSKIIHWQTDFDREHRHFGEFYGSFNDLMDTLVEAIAGKYGKDQLKFGEAAIMVYDYEMAFPEFFGLVEDSLRGTFCSMFDRDQDSELYNIVDEILDVVNKIKYLLQFKP